MKKALACAILGALVFAVPSLADDTPQPLTPTALQHLIECKSSQAELLDYVGMLTSDTPPTSLKPLKDNGHPGMTGLWTCQASEPIMAFGLKVTRVSFIDNWIVTEMRCATAQVIIAENHMARTPIEASEQYYHFLDDDKGPMLGAFAPTDDMLDTVLGVSDPHKAPQKTLFVGCNYSSISYVDFLTAATHADTTIEQTAKRIRRMNSDPPPAR